MKICSKCLKEKELICFTKDRTKKDGLSVHCRECKNKYKKDNFEHLSKLKKEWNRNNRERIKLVKEEYKIRNKERIDRVAKEYRKKNREIIKDRQRRWRSNPENKLKHKEMTKNWLRNNADYVRERDRNRLKKDINYKIKKNLRIRISKAIRSNQKKGSAIRDLGCTVEELKVHLEKQFTPEMNWENYGTYWHIDHIIPLAAFDLTDIEQFKKASHYTNLQPLYWRDNLIKKDKY